MSPKPDVSAERIPQILAAALRVFARQGIEAASMKEIAQEAGLSIGGVYWYYSSKDEIIFDLVKSFVEEDLAQASSVLHSPGSARQRLLTIVTSGLAEAVRLMPITFDIYRQSLYNPNVKAALQEYVSAYRQLFKTLFAQGIAAGEFRPINPDTAAQLLIALYNGLLELSLLDQNPVQTAETFAAILALFFQGIDSKGDVTP